MKVDVLLGLQWGDEGKGKIVDVLTPEYDVIARFQGGPNAGHTLEFDGIKHVLHTIPSGVFRPDTLNVVGNGVVIDPIIFKKEIDALVNLGVDVAGCLAISRKAHLILPTHRLLDAASEAAKGKAKIGSTLKGIGPTYMDKTGRNGLRVGDIESPHFESRYHTLRDKHVAMLGQFDGFEFSVDDAEWLEAVAFLRTLKLIDSEHDMNRALKAGQRILAEGAQGTMLDIDFGTYPFVTSSNTISAGACTGLGIAPNRVGEVFGIFKAYCTRVGSGPFPTELHDEVGEKMRAEGHEFGSHHRPSPPLRLARLASTAVRGGRQRRDATLHDEGRRVGLLRRDRGLHPLHASRRKNRPLAVRHQPRRGGTGVHHPSRLAWGPHRHPRFGRSASDVVGLRGLH